MWLFTELDARIQLLQCLCHQVTWGVPKGMLRLFAVELQPANAKTVTDKRIIKNLFIISPIPFRKRDRLMCSVPVHSYCVNISIYTGHIPWVCPVLDAYYSPSIIHITSSFWRNIVPISGSFGNLQMSSCYRLLPMVFLLSQMRETVCRQVLTARGRPLPHLGPTATHLISAMRLLSI